MTYSRSHEVPAALTSVIEHVDAATPDAKRLRAATVSTRAPFLRVAGLGHFGSRPGGAWRRRRRPASSATARRLLGPRRVHGGFHGNAQARVRIAVYSDIGADGP
jgi:hypothetical protein